MHPSEPSLPSPPRALTCPQCSSPVSPRARYCGNCGVDLTFATVMAERSVLARIPTGRLSPLAAETIVPRIGDYLVQNELITRDQLQDALAQQAERAQRGERQSLGQMLISMGAITRGGLDQALTRMTQDLQNALQESNRKLEQRVQERTQALQEAVEKLSELNELKANFMANLSHELRTPLAQIKGYVALMAEGSLGTLSPDQEKALSVTGRATERLERLIEDLLQFASISRGEVQLKREPVSLREVCAGLYQRSLPKAERKRVHLEVELPDSTVRVDADQDKLSWVLFQLLDNAIKFTPEGGAVRLAFRERDDRVRVSVRDTGIGIPSDRSMEVFAPFHQLDGSATRHYGGTGLGLALVKRLVEAHGSQLEVESEEGRGSAFSFELPMAVTHAAPLTGR